MSLASIQKINKIFPIEGADRIEGAEVLGWKCVVRSLDQTISFKVVNNDYLLKDEE